MFFNVPKTKPAAALPQSPSNVALASSPRSSSGRLFNTNSIVSSGNPGAPPSVPLTPGAPVTGAPTLGAPTPTGAKVVDPSVAPAGPKPTLPEVPTLNQVKSTTKTPSPWAASTTYEIVFFTETQFKREGLESGVTIELQTKSAVTGKVETSSHPIVLDNQPTANHSNFESHACDRFLFQGPEYKVDDIVGIRISLGGTRDIFGPVGWVIDKIVLTGLKFGHIWAFNAPNPPESINQLCPLHDKWAGPAIKNDVIVGPLLTVKGVQDGNWIVNVLYVLRTPMPLLEIVAEALGQTIRVRYSNRWNAPYPDCCIATYTLTIPMVDRPSLVTYHLDSATATPHRFMVPAFGQTPNMAFVSGASEMAMHNFDHSFLDPAVKNEMVAKLNQVHGQVPYHLALRGGNEVTLDACFGGVEDLAIWNRLDDDEGRCTMEFTIEAEQHMRVCMFDLYITHFRQEAIAEMWATIPSLCIWDLHDIFAGWGSLSLKHQSCPVIQGVFRCADEMFRLFQLHNNTTNLVCQPGSFTEPFLSYGKTLTTTTRQNYTHGVVISGVAILLLDTRYERNQAQIMSDESKLAVLRWIDLLPHGIRHLVLVSPVPVFSNRFPDPSEHPDPSRMPIPDVRVWPGKGFAPWPGNETTPVGEHLDFWLHPNHLNKTSDFFALLMRVTRETEKRLLILSGHTHAACQIGIRQEGFDTNLALALNWVSSSIVAPTNLSQAYYNYFVQVLPQQQRPDKVGAKINMYMIPPIPAEPSLSFTNLPSDALLEEQRRTLSVHRNFLSVYDNGHGDLIGVWRIEDMQGGFYAVQSICHRAGPMSIEGRLGVGISNSVQAPKKFQPLILHADENHPVVVQSKPPPPTFFQTCMGIGPAKQRADALNLAKSSPFKVNFDEKRQAFEGWNDRQRIQHVRDVPIDAERQFSPPNSPRPQKPTLADQLMPDLAPSTSGNLSDQSLSRIVRQPQSTIHIDSGVNSVSSPRVKKFVDLATLNVVRTPTASALASTPSKNLLQSFNSSAHNAPAEQMFARPSTLTGSPGVPPTPGASTLGASNMALSTSASQNQLPQHLSMIDRRRSTITGIKDLAEKGESGQEPLTALRSVLHKTTLEDSQQKARQEVENPRVSSLRTAMMPSHLVREMEKKARAEEARREEEQLERERALLLEEAEEQQLNSYGHLARSASARESDIKMPEVSQKSSKFSLAGKLAAETQVTSPTASSMQRRNSVLDAKGNVVDPKTVEQLIAEAEKRGQAQANLNSNPCKVM